MLSEPGAGLTHPKNVLYDEVYDPVTVAWFEELDHSKRRAELLAEAPRFDVLRNLSELNSLFHDLVDVCLDSLGGKTDYMMAVIREHREHVLWEGQMIPAFDADDKQIRAAFSNKIKRNISMGAVEAVICLEGAAAFAKHSLGLHGQQLTQVLKRSLQLCASLAFLHDVQEQHRLQFLTGEDGYLKYPEVSFADVIIGGRYRIPPQMFSAVGSGDCLQLRFIKNRAYPGPFDTPIKRCPAHRFPSRSDRDLVLNDVLWRLIVDLYDRSGRLA